MFLELKIILGTVEEICLIMEIRLVYSFLFYLSNTACTLKPSRIIETIRIRSTWLSRTDAVFTVFYLRLGCFCIAKPQKNLKNCRTNYILEISG